MRERAERTRRLLKPRSVAIIGASAEPAAAGAVVLANLTSFSFSGEIHLVSRSRDEIGGRRCLHSIDELPADVDVAVLCVPQESVLETVASCARRNVGTAIVFAAGFAEVDAEMRTEQEALTRLAQQKGISVCGPNCMGLVNFVDGVPLTFGPTPVRAPGDGPAIAVVAQSGAMAGVVRNALFAKGQAVSYVITTGNEADLALEDFLEFLVDDRSTGVIALFAEQIRQPPRFLSLANRSRAAGKPIILLHPGRTARARSAALSHTGALVGNYEAMATQLRHASVIQVETLEELFDTAELLAAFPTPPTKGVSVITNSGAVKGFVHDFSEHIRLDVATLSPPTIEALREIMPSYASIDNPLDVTGYSIRNPSIYGDAAELLLADPAVGSLVVSVTPGGKTGAMDKANSLARVMAAPAKPLAVVAMGDNAPLADEFVKMIGSYNVPLFRSPERVLRALAHTTSYGRSLASSAAPSARSRISAIPLPGEGTISEHASKGYLATLGVPVPPGRLVQDLDEARTVADDIGYPVVLKAQSSDLTHKSDAGGVLVGIGDGNELSSAWQRLHANLRVSRPGIVLDGVLIEKVAEDGVDMVLGANRDAEWGAVVMLGLGGIWVEVLKDIRLFPTTVDKDFVLSEIGALQGAKLLQGLRGMPAADIGSLAETVLKICSLMDECPTIREIDINPLRVLPKDKGVVALDALLVLESGA